MRDPVEEFRSYNRPFARRNPELLRYKVARMAESAFAFFRGSFHLFARDVLSGASGPLPLFTGAGVEMDLVGDVHSENYGTYKAEDGLIHYDVNDFDETTTGRFDFDICRLGTSLFLASRDRADPLDRAALTALTAITAYTATLRRPRRRPDQPAGRAGRRRRLLPARARLRAGLRRRRPPRLHALRRRPPRPRRRRDLGDGPRET